MVNLYLKQRWFSWGDNFEVYDERGSVRYIVESEIFTFGRKLHVYDANMNEMAFIRQEVLTFMRPRYYIEIGGREVAEIIKEITFFSHEYTVEGPGWSVTGDFFDHDYTVSKNGSTIASVAKEWFTLGDAYEISIENDVDELLALTVVLVIDCCLEKN